MNREPFLGLPSVDIGTVRRIVLVDTGYTEHFVIHTDRGVFDHNNDKSWRAYQMGFEYVTWGDPNRPFRAWAMSESLALIGSLARFEYEMLGRGRIGGGEDVPLLSDAEGWDYMLRNRFPMEPKDAWKHFDNATWVDIEGNETRAPDWFLSYWVKLLCHRQDEILVGARDPMGGAGV